MRIIAVVGDSHTWGEGVGGEYGFSPPVVCGDKRMLSFVSPCYVNLLRDALSLTSPARVVEYAGETLAALCGASDRDFGRITPDHPLSLTTDFSFCRLFVAAGDAEDRSTEPVTVTVTVDGDEAGVMTLPERGGDVDPATDVYPLHAHAARDGRHTLTVTATGAPVLLHRIECYGGDWALVNCGIGSCPVGTYMTDYYEKYVAPLRPFGVLFEGCTINDWLTGETPEAYAATLTQAVAILRELTPRILAHTVFPIAGAQTVGASAAPYPTFVRTMRETLEALDVPVVDTYDAMDRALRAVPEGKRDRFLYHDLWHPNATGHILYAREILPALRKMLGEGTEAETFRPMRRWKQALDDDACDELLRTCPRGVLAVHGCDGYPYAFPMDFLWQDGKLYFHCAKVGHKLDALDVDDRASFCVMDGGYRREGEWALNIRSVIAFGRVRRITDAAETARLAYALALKYHPTPEGAAEEVRKAVGRVQILEMTVSHMTGKLVNES